MAISNVAQNPATHPGLVASGILPWAIRLLLPTTTIRASEPDGVSALCSTLSAISRDRALARRALEGSLVFEALAAALKEHETNEGVAESAALATHRLVDDGFGMRTLPVEAGLPAALVRAAKAHGASERVVLAVTLALVRFLSSLRDGEGPWCISRRPFDLLAFTGLLEP